MARPIPRDAPVIRTARPLMPDPGPAQVPLAGCAGQSAGTVGLGRYFGVTVLTTILPFASLTLTLTGLGLPASQRLTAAWAAWQAW